MSTPPSGSPPTRCLNCDAALTGTFCTKCGQDARRQRLTIRGIVRDTIEHVLDLEIPILRTLRDMTVRPGRMVSEYVEGKRARFTNPLKYCLMCGALFVALNYWFSFPGLSMADDFRAREGEPTTPAAIDLMAIFEWFETYQHIYFFACLPFLGAIMRLLFWNSGRNFAEQYVLALYAYGHIYLLQLVFGLLAFVLPWMVWAAWLGPFIYFSWAAVGFCRGNPWLAALLSFIAHTAFGIGSLTILFVGGFLLLSLT